MKRLLKAVGKKTLKTGADLATGTATEIVSNVKTTIKIYMYLGIAAGVLVVSALAYGVYSLIF